jgi:hypothetical protein
MNGYTSNEFSVEFSVGTSQKEEVENELPSSIWESIKENNMILTTKQIPWVNELIKTLISIEFSNEGVKNKI